jgi:hypothetical protein
VADSRYGIIENYLFCHDSGIKPHIRSLAESQRGSGRREDIFPKEAFVYNPATDTFTCPSGKKLRRRHFYKDRRHYEYQASRGVCPRCRLRWKCTRSSYGRTLKRHERQQELDRALQESQSPQAREDLKIRQHLSERSFARSVRYGFKRARWRRWWRVQIQDFLIAAIQNIMVLITHGLSTLSKSRKRSNSVPNFLNYFTQNILLLLTHLKRLAPSPIFAKLFGQQPV